jgi:predicted  nucleic acid-binding Zn-ribbon protein
MKPSLRILALAALLAVPAFAQSAPAPSPSQPTAEDLALKVTILTQQRNQANDQIAEMAVEAQKQINSLSAQVADLQKQLAEAKKAAPKGK